MLPKYLVRGVTFSPDGGVAIDYMEPLKDLRKNDLAINHSIYIPAEDEYEDEIEEVQKTILYLLADALEDFHAMPPLVESDLTFEADEEDDDE